VFQHDPDRPEDMDTSAEDYAADEARYACMSRPYIGQPAEKPKSEKMALMAWGPRITQRWEQRHCADPHRRLLVDEAERRRDGRDRPDWL
jgi:hypothetical protein